MRITKNVYMLSGSPWEQVGNVFAVRADNQLILIDSGQDEQTRRIVEDSMRSDGIWEIPVRWVIMTHMHIDHAGNAWYYRQHGAKIAAGEFDASGIETGGARVNDFQGNEFRTCPVDVRIKDGEKLTIGNLDIVAHHMPGHTNGSMFYSFETDGKKFICTGDTITPGEGRFGGPVAAQFGWPDSIETNPEKYVRTLRKAAQFQADIILPGHGTPLMQNGSELFVKGIEAGRTYFGIEPPEEEK